MVDHTTPKNESSVISVRRYCDQFRFASSKLPLVAVNRRRYIDDDPLKAGVVVRWPASMVYPFFLSSPLKLWTQLKLLALIARLYNDPVWLDGVEPDYQSSYRLLFPPLYKQFIALPLIGNRQRKLGSRRIHSCDIVFLLWLSFSIVLVTASSKSSATTEASGSIGKPQRKVIERRTTVGVRCKNNMATHR